eukprot:167469-Rhodomonas_salina.3
MRETLHVLVAAFAWHKCKQKQIRTDPLCALDHLPRGCHIFVRTLRRSIVHKNAGFETGCVRSRTAPDPSSESQVLEGLHTGIALIHASLPACTLVLCACFSGVKAAAASSCAESCEHALKAASRLPQGSNVNAPLPPESKTSAHHLRTNCTSCVAYWL